MYIVLSYFDFLNLSNIYYFYDGSRTGCSIASFYLLKNIMGGFEMIEIGRLPELDKQVIIQKNYKIL